MDINEFKKDEYLPTHFMTVFTNEARDKYLEIGPILQDDKKKFYIGPSAPVSEEFLNDLVELIHKKEFKSLKFKGLTPSNVIYHHCDNRKPQMLWWRPAEKRELIFSAMNKIESGEYEMPPILFYLNKGELHVFRFQGIIDAETPLYKVPLPNIYVGGAVCLGSLKSKLKKPKSLEDIISLYEDLFYRTSFNMFHDPDLFEKGVIYEEIAKEKNMNLWPVMPTKLTVKSLLK